MKSLFSVRGVVATAAFSLCALTPALAADLRIAAPEALEEAVRSASLTSTALDEGRTEAQEVLRDG